ncbi:MAG: LysR family transcriptional regulator [Gammaproteobacteria bacterium]
MKYQQFYDSMHLNQLLIFSKIAQHKSFTKAATELQIDKSTVSNNLAKLESRLGVRLLNRSTRSVTLTEAGQGYYQYCQQIVETAEEAEQFTATLGKEAVGLLRVAALNDFSQIFIPKVIQPFMEANPKVDMELILEYRNTDLVKERVDIALRFGIVPLEDSDLISKKILDDELGLYCSPGFIDKYGKLVDVSQINDFDLIELFMGPHIQLPIKKGNASYTIDMKGRFKVNDLLSAKDAALSGLGIAALSKLLSQEAVEKKQLVPLLTDWQFPSVAVYAIYPSRQWMPAKLKVFLLYLEQL